MPACRTRWWRCATARWAGRSPGSQPTHGAGPQGAAPPSPAARRWAKEAAERVAVALWRRRAPTKRALARWREDATRTTYLFDVRDPAEYEAGHLPGAVSAPGGQLVQATDQYAGTMGARIVLADPLEARALMTGAWLKRMGWRDVFVLAEAGSVTGRPAPAILGLDEAPAHGTRAGGARNTVGAGRGERGRSRLEQILPRGPYRGRMVRDPRAPRTRAAARARARSTLVLTSEDGILARLAVARSGSLRARPGALPRRRHGGLGRIGPAARARRRAHGGRAHGSVAQGL